jgi:predicted nucleic acid-binding Zn ribbon protein
MARKTNLIKLGDAINQLFKDAKLDVKISRFSVKNSWKEIVGEVISKNTSGIFFNDKVIFVTLSSAALKHELSFRKQEIVDNINGFCGYKLVEDIVIK